MVRASISDFRFADGGVGFTFQSLEFGIQVSIKVYGFRMLGGSVARFASIRRLPINCFFAEMSDGFETAKMEPVSCRVGVWC